MWRIPEKCTDARSLNFEGTANYSPETGLLWGVKTEEPIAIGKLPREDMTSPLYRWQILHTKPNPQISPIVSWDKMAGQGLSSACLDRTNNPAPEKFFSQENESVWSQGT